MTRPLVSVIVASFNRTEYLMEAVESVIHQTWSDWELLIADDGSDEPTKRYLAKLADPRVHVLWLQHSGNPAAVRNAALNIAHGEYVAFLDSDDAWMPSKLAAQLQGLRSSADCRWSYTNFRRIDRSGNEIVDPRI